MNYNRGRGRGRGKPRYTQQYAAGHQSGPSPSTIPIPINKNLSVITVDLELDEAGSQWMSQLRSNWNYIKNSPIVVNMVLRKFEQAANPYEETLRIVYNCPDFKYAKQKSLAIFVIDEFKKWCQRVRSEIIHLLTGDVKLSAFNVVRQQNNFSMMKLVAEVYEMLEDCDIFFDIIQCMIQQKQYKEACQSVALLGLHKKFGINEFLVPLVLQDKTAVVEDFLADSIEHQTELVSFLDSKLGKNTSVRMAWDSYIHEHKIPEIKYDKIHTKPFRKFITRYKKMYNLLDEVTPNLIKKQNEGALQFLLQRRYVKNAIGDESFKEMVHEAVQNDKYLQLELVLLAAQYGDTETALHFALLYGIPKHDWPYNVRMYVDNPNNERHQQQQPANLFEEENWDEPVQQVDYYKLNLPIGNICLVDCHTEFNNFLENNLKHAHIVGIDCEWKPSFGSQKNELALMQIATRDEVFILDVIQLGSGAGAAQLWENLGRYCFNNCDILKLGFGLTSDMSMIGQSLPHTNINQKIGFLDLLNIWRQMEKQNIKLPFEVQSGGPSLSTLVQQCFGAPLNKADQFSNWEKRPLRDSQLVYAALDAYCLIEIYDVLKQCCENTTFNFDEACYHLMTSSNSSLKKSKKGLNKKKTVKPVLKQPPNTDFPVVDASDITFVCDTMLQGLGKLLRKCGISTKILDNTDDHMTCLKIYQDEGRYILTRGQTFSNFYGSVPKGHCFNVIYDDLEDALKSVLEYYKITVRKEHVFSICQACNSNSFLKLSKSTMQTLVRNDKFKMQNPIPAGLEEDDEATGFSSEEEVDDDFYMTAKLPDPPISRKWDLCSDEPVDVGLCRLRNGVKINVQAVPDGVLEKQDMYYVCEMCGKVYWDGTHFERALAGKLQEVVL